MLKERVFFISQPSNEARGGKDPYEVLSEKYNHNN